MLVLWWGHGGLLPWPSGASLFLRVPGLPFMFLPCSCCAVLLLDLSILCFILVLPTALVLFSWTEAGFGALSRELGPFISRAAHWIIQHFLFMCVPMVVSLRLWLLTGAWVTSHCLHSFSWLYSYTESHASSQF